MVLQEVGNCAWRRLHFLFVCMPVIPVCRICDCFCAYPPHYKLQHVLYSSWCAEPSGLKTCFLPAPCVREQLTSWHLQLCEQDFSVSVLL